MDVNVNSVDYDNNYDPDANLPNKTNFIYYSLNEFNDDNNISLCSSQNHFSAFHCNVRSLNANFDKLTDLLHQLTLSFSLIGITETKLRNSVQNLLNINIPGYKFISKPSLSYSPAYSYYLLFCYINR